MAKLLILKSCRYCGHLREPGARWDEDYYCLYPKEGKAARKLPNSLIIPKWCKLPDFPEQETGEKQKNLPTKG